MSGVMVYGFPLSTYVRTVRMALAEKGVTYTLEPFERYWRTIHSWRVTRSVWQICFWLR